MLGSKSQPASEFLGVTIIQNYVLYWWVAALASAIWSGNFFLVSILQTKSVSNIFARVLIFQWKIFKIRKTSSVDQFSSGSTLQRVLMSTCKHLSSQPDCISLSGKMFHMKWFYQEVIPGLNQRPTYIVGTQCSSINSSISSTINILWAD